MAKRQNDLRRYALIGAQQEIARLELQLENILRQFPELRRGRGAAAKGSRQATAAADVGSADRPTKRRRRRTMSAEARKRISEAQKARWAKQKSTPHGQVQTGGARKKR